jgi:uncharacterized protein (DUF2141 family)
MTNWRFRSALGAALAIVGIFMAANALLAADPTTAPTSSPAGQASSVPATQPALAHLLIHVVDVRNANGNLVFGVFSQAQGFPSSQKDSANWQVKPAGAAVDFSADLPPGDYAASVLHDENSNGKMDKNFAGIPIEGYGVTNNPKPKFRAATFKEAQFRLPPEGATLSISIQYQFY